ncbi:nitroreductase/quinone reductase family protein [Amycolatopsis sp. cmx-8-4]|uniref:nitroreductase/quinone reductase family protein n=1 Tax=Amycolatopsis sp. cmx-8-4 TaxID=2790947 RepID=UPI00397C6A95
MIYGTAGDDFVVVASKGGADEDPAWLKNLQADPSVGVQGHETTVNLIGTACSRCCVTPCVSCPATNSPMIRKISPLTAAIRSSLPAKW